MAESDAPFDRWHKKYPKPGDVSCRCGTKKNPLYPSADHGRGLQWQARYTDPDGKPRRPTFETWEKARDHLDEIRVALRSNSWVDPEPGKKTVAFYADELIARRKRKKKNYNTTKNYESHLHSHIKPFAGTRPAQTLTRRDTMAFIDFLLDRPGLNEASSVIQVYKTWRILMNYMVDADAPLPANICARIELPDVDPRVSVALSPEQVADLAAAMSQVAPRLEILVWIGACAGLRKGEAFGLTKDAVDWDQDLLYVREQRQDGRSAKLKTRTSYATLPVDHFLIVRLKEHVETFPQVAPVCAETARQRRARGYVPPADEGLIVTNRLGRPLKREAFRHYWKAAVELAGLPGETRFHDLKHFYTTRLGSSGDFDPKTVQALSRHAEFSETWDTYAHPPLAVQGVKVRTFGSLFAAA
ncbi:site-specific recombinase XerD [Streptomyces sp. Ag109_O5-1]|uniref:tyrosine-type recombinase/integrase n=1 Tax=Streptomyces sp. Ag109_O5-1 TaxID=1938851 RepID=UPI000F4F198B|nr:site-specific integrase [Streptomyces sp. Ag109_O5-1]RPE39239.1 site-specific recombinase XerD [Streptomyces sp. Ag109_O5-1]